MALQAAGSCQDSRYQLRVQVRSARTSHRTREGCSPTPTGVPGKASWEPAQGGDTRRNRGGRWRKRGARAARSPRGVHGIAPAARTRDDARHQPGSPLGLRSPSLSRLRCWGPIASRRRILLQLPVTCRVASPPQPRFRWGEPGGERRQCRGGPRLLRTVLRALRLLTRSADVAFFGGWRDAFPAPFLGRRGGAALPDGACPAGCTLLGGRLPEPRALHRVDSAMDSKSAERMTLSSDTRYLAGSGFSMVNGTWQLHTTSPKKRPVRCSLATHLPRHPQLGVSGGQKPRPFPLSGRPPPKLQRALAPVGGRTESGGGGGGAARRSLCRRQRGPVGHAGRRVPAGRPSSQVSERPAPRPRPGATPPRRPRRDQAEALAQSSAPRGGCGRAGPAHVCRQLRGGRWAQLASADPS